MTERKSQIEKFKKVARELDCDDSEAAFDERLREIAKSPPRPAKKVKDKAPE